MDAEAGQVIVRIGIGETKHAFIHYIEARLE